MECSSWSNLVGVMFGEWNRHGTLPSGGPKASKEKVQGEMARTYIRWEDKTVRRITEGGGGNNSTGKVPSNERGRGNERWHRGERRIPDRSADLMVGVCVKKQTGSS